MALEKPTAVEVKHGEHTIAGILAFRLSNFYAFLHIELIDLFIGFTDQGASRKRNYIYKLFENFQNNIRGVGDISPPDFKRSFDSFKWDLRFYLYSESHKLKKCVNQEIAKKIFEELEDFKLHCIAELSCREKDTIH